MQIDRYAYRSNVNSWNAGFKVLLSIGTLCMVIAFDEVMVSLFVIMSLGAFTLGVGKTPVRVYLRFMSVPLAFMICSGIAIAAQFSSLPSGEWNISAHFFYLCLTKSGIKLAVQVSVKAIAGMSAVYMMAFSTPMHEIIGVMQKIRLPGLLIELMNLIYRYIFILFDVAAEMQTAARARLGYQSFRKSLRTFALIAGSLFVVSLRKANAYYDALLSRGYDGKIEFLTEKKRLKAWQAAGGAIYFTAVILIWRFCKR